MPLSPDNYAAHIVAAGATALGEPGIVVTAENSDAGESWAILDYALAPDEDPHSLLTSNGWGIVGDPTEVESGYTVLPITPVDWPVILKVSTARRRAADAEKDRAYHAWTTLVGAAMRDRSIRQQDVAELTGISVQRAGQIQRGER